MSRVVFVDTSRIGRGDRRRRKPHVCYDGEKTFEIYDLTRLKDYDEILIDTLFPEIYDEIMELLRKGIKIYCLKDTTALKRLRKENNLKKTDIIDANILSRIPAEEFRPLTFEELKFKIQIKPLIRKYERIVWWKKKLKILIKDGFDYNFKESLRLMNADGKKVSREIIKQVTNLPIYGEVYRKACEILGVNNSTELAILVVELPLHLSLVKLKGLLGFTPNKNWGRYYHRLRKTYFKLCNGLLHVC